MVQWCSNPLCGQGDVDSSLPDFCMLPWFSFALQNRFLYITNLHNIIVAVPKFVPIPISEFDVHNTQGHDSRNNVLWIKEGYQSFKCMLKMIDICFTWK